MKFDINNQVSAAADTDTEQRISSAKIDRFLSEFSSFKGVDHSHLTIKSIRPDGKCDDSNKSIVFELVRKIIRIEY